MEKKVISIYVKLTEEELSKKATELTNKLIEKDDKEDCLKSYVKDEKGKIAIIDSCIKTLTNVVNKKEESRNVECNVDKDITTKTVKYLYEGEIVMETPFSISDYQMELEDITNVEKEINVSVAKKGKGKIHKDSEEV